MTAPVLLIMAAGMGSRYGGLKQIDPVDAYGNSIIDFSIYDALRAGFGEIVFLIKHEIECDFREAVGERIARRANVAYAFQELTKIPAGVALPEGRTKPLGTTHAVLCAREAVAGRPFAVINADDYYGAEAFSILRDFLTAPRGANEHAAVGYRVENTLTDHGGVTRGVCEVSGGGYLTDIVERMKIVRTPGGAAYAADDGSPVAIPAGTTVSMNCWAFSPGIFDKFETRFARDLAPGLAKNPQKYEDLLPMAVCETLGDGETSVKVIPTKESWFGVTYKEDMPLVRESLAALKRSGLYPEKLWD
ncbi:MAG TPA: sugar phosphate nucleotidyltransferase [Clostridia bacterium]|nr:sugar phosphate nucleotidyltransferase [Clostridia bacterium]